MRVNQTSLIGNGGGHFPSTRWTLVNRMQRADEKVTEEQFEQIRKESLGELIEIYWKPLYFFVRRRNEIEEAKDLIQAFFTALIEKDFLSSVQEDKGRLRSFLLVALEHFLANEYDKRKALKRGGDRCFFSLDFNAAESTFLQEPIENDTPEMLYQKKWARALTAQALTMLKQEFEAKNKGKIFAAIEAHLGGGHGYHDLAPQLGLSLQNLKVTVHRARKRYGEMVRLAVRDYVDSESEVDQELKELMEIL